MDIGEADIAVEATYLKYNRTSISQKYNVLAKVIPLEMALDHADAYGLQTLPQSQMTLRITHEGKPLSQAQWDAMPPAGNLLCAGCRVRSAQRKRGLHL